MAKEEHEEYIEDSLTIFKGMKTFSHDEWILNLSCSAHYALGKNILIHSNRRRHVLFLWVMGPFMMSWVLGR